MIDSFSTTGLVATEPSHSATGEGVALMSFRLASTPRKFNRESKTWEYGETNWFTVTAFRHLALNLIQSIKKGDRVIVMGRMRIREWTSQERSGTVVEITADSVGHDLTWGTAVYSRTTKSAPVGVDTSTPTVSDAFDPDEPAQEASVGSGWADAAGESEGLHQDSDGRAAVLVGE
ncbi:single-stranded DNA-binding protein [Rathayibacter soli]|uniref:single-stranded DNA-binding protein n=1 Tax=Rathayibacter soli TaxID=3144168 RepID=UPI0027E3CD53|nr:single-stranded DNA-binding protein [Glaciibacter superstes]